MGRSEGLKFIRGTKDSGASFCRITAPRLKQRNQRREFPSIFYDLIKGTYNQLACSVVAVAIVLGREPSPIAPSGRAMATHPRLPVKPLASRLCLSALLAPVCPPAHFSAKSPQGLFACNQAYLAYA
jgi:hypothetical protein